MKIDYVNETVECGQIFILAFRQLRKKGYLNLSDNFKSYVMYLIKS